jgi:uncharacterized delta-60 repeat protein
MFARCLAAGATRRELAFLLLLCCGVFAAPAWAADGDLDPTFHFDGVATLQIGNNAGWFGDEAIQPDGKVVASRLGTYCGAGGGVNWLVSRFHADGSLDSSFGTGGRVHLPDLGMCPFLDSGQHGQGAYAVEVLADGSLLAGGGCGRAFSLARYTTTGHLDPGFGTNGLSRFTPVDPSHGFDMAIQSDGRALLAGVTGLSSSIKLGITRFLSNGSVDPSFGNRRT